MSSNSSTLWSQNTGKRQMMKVLWIFVLANASVSLSSSHDNPSHERVVNKRHVKNVRQKTNSKHNVNHESFYKKLTNKNLRNKMCFDAKYKHIDEVIDSLKNLKKMKETEQKYQNVHLRDIFELSTKGDNLMEDDSSGYEMTEQMRFKKKNEEYFQKLLEAIQNINSETYDMALGHKNQSEDQILDDLRKLEDSKRNEGIYRRLVLFKNKQNLQRHKGKSHEGLLNEHGQEAHWRPAVELSEDEKSLILRKMQDIDDNECIYKGLRHAKENEFREKHPGCLILSDEEQLFEKQTDADGQKTYKDTNMIYDEKMLLKEMQSSEKFGELTHDIDLNWQSEPSEAEQQYLNHQRKLFLQSIPESLLQEMLRQEVDMCRKMYHGDVDIELLLANITRIDDLPPSLHELSGPKKLKTLHKSSQVTHKKSKDRLKIVNQGEGLSHQNQYVASKGQTQKDTESVSTIQTAEMIECPSQNGDVEKIERNYYHNDKPKEFNIQSTQGAHDHTETIQIPTDHINTHIKHEGYYKEEPVKQGQRMDRVMDFKGMHQKFIPTYSNKYKHHCKTHAASHTQFTEKAFREEQEIKLAYVQYIQRIEKINYKHLCDLSRVHSKHLKVTERVHDKYMQNIKQIREKHADLYKQRRLTAEQIRSHGIANYLSPSHLAHLEHVKEINTANAEYVQEMENQHSKYTAAVHENNKLVSDTGMVQHTCSTEIIINQAKEDEGLEKV